MGERLSTEDLTGRRPATQVDEDVRDARSEVEEADGAPVRSPLSDPNRAEDAPRASSARDDGPAAGDRSAAEANEPLLDVEDGTRFERRWHQVQVAFVDEPRAAVEQADELVAELMRHLAETFADERGRLEAAWSAGENVDTEALRVALTRYRSFFHRLLQT
jgi:hypothetical protein